MSGSGNYVKLRDIGKAIGVDVSYDGSKYIPKAGDRGRCDDGYIYEVKDISRYDNNVFADGPVGPLSTPTCDWSAFP